jgi:hypothetical protein
MSLKGELDTFGELFRQRINGVSKATIRWVTCTAVNWDDKTMTATDSDDLEYFDILLGVDAVIAKPMVGCDCLISIVENDEATAFLLKADAVELLQYNGGENGGLIKIDKLTTDLNKLVTEVNSIRATLLSHTHGVAALPNPSGTVINTVATVALLEKASNFDKDNYNNDKITH